MTDASPMPPHLLFCACPDRETARRLAETLVEERLAACVNLVPGVASVYRWEGRLQHDEEVLLLIKTAGARLPEVIERLSRLHPYELPEIVALPIAAGLPRYLQWIDACTVPHD